MSDVEHEREFDLPFQYPWNQIEGSGTLAPGTPIADNLAASTDENVTIQDIMITGTWGNNPSATITTNGSKGTATLDGVLFAFDYVPNAGVFGSDFFYFTITDDSGLTSPTAYVRVSITGDAPVVSNSSTSTDINVPIMDFDFLSAAVSRGTVSVSVVTAPENGTYNPDNNLLDYTPNNGFYGTDTLIYTITDDTGQESNQATVTITVNLVVENFPYTFPFILG